MAGLFNFLGSNTQDEPSKLDGIMPYLAMIAKGASPFSDIDPQAMMALHQRQQQLAMQRKQHAYELKLRQDELARDNARADEALGLKKQMYTDKQSALDATRQAEAGVASLLGEADAGDRATAMSVPDFSGQGVPYTQPPPVIGAQGMPGQAMPGQAAPLAAPSTPPDRDVRLQKANQNIQNYMLEKGDALTPATRARLTKTIEQNESMMGTPEWVKTPQMAKEFHEADVKTRVADERSKPARDAIYRGTINAADEAIEMLNTDVGGRTGRFMESLGVSRLTGLPAWAAKKYPGSTPASELGEKLETIKAGSQVEAMMALKQASSTGSTGMGSLTEKEGEILQKLQGSLNQERQNPETLKRNITRIRNFAQAMKSGITITDENENAILNKGLSPAGMTTSPGKKSTGWTIEEVK